MTGVWHLAPAYDLTFEVGSGNTARHQMTLGGKTDNFTRELLIEAGKKFDIRRPGAVIDEVVDAFSGGVGAHWLASMACRQDRLRISRKD